MFDIGINIAYCMLNIIYNYYMSVIMWQIPRSNNRISNRPIKDENKHTTDYREYF